MAMPVYAMSCFKLPIGVIDEIEAILMNYWWEKNAKKRGIPWIAWNRLQYAKKEGGLGFRDLSKFNDALLAKQVWRLIKYPNSLFARIMKARYFKDDSILDAKPRSYQSYGWTSMLAGLDVIKKGSRFVVGDGKSIRFGKDNVIDSHPPRPIKTIVPETTDTVHSLISKKGSFRFWNNHNITQVIDPSDQNIIKNIYLSRNEVSDRLIWHYTTSGFYTVRSGYWLLTHDPLDSQPKPPIPHGSTDLKTKIWKLPIIPKIKYMLWRIITRALPTRSRLTSRGMNIDPHCPRCTTEEESISHVLFTCSFANIVWRLSNSPILLEHHFSEDTEDNLSYIVDSYLNQNLPDIHKLLPFWLIWKIWKARNNLVFNSFRESPSRLVLNAKAEVEEWISTRKEKQKQTSGPRQPQHQKLVWTKPSSSFVKCNFDAGVDISTSRGTAGWIIRDHVGKANVWGFSKLGHIASPLEAETKALLVAIQQAWIRGYRNIQFEGDCEILIKAINGSSQPSEIANLLLDIDFWSSKFTSVVFTFAGRQCNRIAHFLASSVCNNRDFYSESVYQPLWLRKLLCNDSNS